MNNLSDNKCMHKYIHTYIHTYIHAYMHTCIHAFMHSSIHPSIHPSIHTYKSPGYIKMLIPLLVSYLGISTQFLNHKHRLRSIKLVKPDTFLLKCFHQSRKVSGVWTLSLFLWFSIGFWNRSDSVVFLELFWQYDIFRIVLTVWYF
jgi:hypothetical protein